MTSLYHFISLVPELECKRPRGFPHNLQLRPMKKAIEDGSFQPHVADAVATVLFNYQRSGEVLNKFLNKNQLHLTWERREICLRYFDTIISRIGNRVTVCMIQYVSQPRKRLQPADRCFKCGYGNSIKTAQVPGACSLSIRFRKMGSGLRSADLAWVHPLSSVRRKQASITWTRWATLGLETSCLVRVGVRITKAVPPIRFLLFPSLCLKIQISSKRLLYHGQRVEPPT